MKKFTITSVFLLLISFAFGQIDFRDGSWEELLKMAQMEDKPVFVDAYAVWCGPCKRMASEVFTQESVGDFFNKNFINAKIDMEKGEGPTIGSKYGVTAYPTLLFISPEGELMHKAIGYQTADRLINNGNIALNKTNKSKEFTQKYEGGERDPEFVLEYMKQLNKAEKPTEKIALEYFQESRDINPEMKAMIAFEALKNMDSQLLKYVMEGKDVIRSYYDQSIIDERLITASENTIHTAIQYNAPSVFHQLIESLEKLDISPAVLSTIQRTYYAKTKDEEAFLASIQSSLEKDESNACDLAMEIYKAFPNSTAPLEYARKIFDQKFPMDLTMDNYVTGLSLAIGLQDYVYMEQLFGTMQMKPNPSSTELRQIEALYQKARGFLQRTAKQN
ncbi:MAG TPA: thioredoxin domain-containing protein [Membranihabitans sp.]|nr:thioredoxin domain-containing protein [Membranihabitans sp.]